MTKQVTISTFLEHESVTYLSSMEHDRQMEDIKKNGT